MEASEVQTLPAPGFISGAHTLLRPVLESDLPGMARIMCEAPLGFDWEQTPWTTQRLKKKFEDEKEPGLWGARVRYLVITETAGELCGVLREEVERNGRVELELHIADAHPARATLWPDALAAYMEYRQSWLVTPRVSMFLLDVQQAEREWLLAQGFTHQLTAMDAWFHLGERVALEAFAWIPDWVMANRAADGIGV